MFSLGDKVLKFFEQEAPEYISENLEKLTVRDLLTMCFGHHKGHLFAEERILLEETNWIKYVLEQPMPYAPGEKFIYNNAGPYLAGVIV